MSLVSFTHELPLHAVSPGLHAKVHALCMHAGCALGTVVAHTLLQPPQSFGLLVGSMHVVPHSSGVLVAHSMHE
jgi:hypothetical protein